MTTATTGHLTHCTSCGALLTTRYPKAVDPLTGETFAILTCSGCGLGHTSPRPDDLGRYYAGQYYGNRHGFTLQYCNRRRISFIEQSLTIGRRGRLLDIGCGDGSFLLAARDSGWQVNGTELNPGPARKRGLEVVDNIESIKGEQQFDCITMWHTLEHMRSIPHMLGEAHRLLKHDGCLVIAVPDFGGLQSRMFRAHWLHADVPRHLYHLDAKSLTCALKQSGFSVRVRWHQEFEYDLLGWSQSALNTIMPRHPNLFFDLLTGKRCTAGITAKAAAFAMGSILTLSFIPPLVISTLLQRGGSLIAAARKIDTGKAPA